MTEPRTTTRFDEGLPVALDEAERLGAHTVAVRETETGRTFTAPMSVVESYRGMSVNRGLGEQWALPLEFWVVTSGREIAVQVALAM